MSLVAEGMNETDENSVTLPFADGNLINHSCRNDNCDDERSSSDSSCSSKDSNSMSSTLTCVGIQNQISCQSEEGMYTPFWRSLMKTY